MAVPAHAALLTAIALATLALPAAALAAPEDPPVESVQPADGAVLPVNADGIEVRSVAHARIDEDVVDARVGGVLRLDDLEAERDQPPPALLEAVCRA